MKPTVSEKMTLGPVRQVDPAQGRIERREEKVLRQNLRARHLVEERRFAGIGVADERDDRVRRLLALGAVQRARAAYLIELLLQAFDLFLQLTPVGLDLRFAGTAEEACTAALAFEVGPRANQAPALVVEVSEFDLKPAFLGPRAPAEDL